MGKPIVHFEVTARNPKRAHAFYQTLFGWKINANNPINYGLVNTGSKKGIQGGIGQVDPSQTPYTTFYVEVENPQAYLDKAMKLGGQVILPVTEIPNMVTFAQFADPEGNVIGLVKSENRRSTQRKTSAKKSPTKARRKG